jgi:indolepyruvate decarboxylase
MHCISLPLNVPHMGQQDATCGILLTHVRGGNYTGIGAQALTVSANASGNLQGYYASMGFGVPAALGAEIGTGARSLLLSGDGAFQMTGPEISHAPKLGLRPIIIVVNNASWGIFRPVSARKDLLSLPVWPYAEMAQGWGGLGVRVTQRDQLGAALLAAEAAESFALIECVTDKDDLSPITRCYIAASAARAGMAGANKV